jgi:large subunit ribosomal protein L6
MSRVAKTPIPIPAGVDVVLDGQAVEIKGPKGKGAWTVHPLVEVQRDGNILKIAPKAPSTQSWAQAGTTRALLANMVTGVSTGFQKKLTLVGVGYRAQSKGQVINLSLGYSHPIDFPVPEGIKIETPSQTEILVSGADRQQVGQVAANLRSLRPPEPYKGKGVRYADEQVLRKETKKKK